jgi:CRP/FNR family transcriptional regulator
LDAVLLAELDLAGLKGTFLGDLEDDSRRALLVEATVLEVAPGSAIFPEGARVPRLGVLLDGMARTFLTAADGRQLTVRNVRTGGMLSSVSGLGGAQVAVGTQAVTSCVVVELPIETAVRLARSDTHVAMGFVTEISRRLEETYATLFAIAFASVRERVAVQLLEVATDSAGVGLVASLTQQQLADTVGSVREVIARVLREFRDEGIVTTTHGGIAIADPDRLVSIAARWRAPRRLYPVSPGIGSDAYLEANPDSVVAIDSHGTIIYANPSVGGMFRWQPKDLIGQPVDRLLPARLASRHAAHLKTFVARPSARPMGIGRELRARRADGSEFPVEISLAPVQTPDGVAVFATIVDISYRAELTMAVNRVRSRTTTADDRTMSGDENKKPLVRSAD